MRNSIKSTRSYSNRQRQGGIHGPVFRRSPARWRPASRCTLAPQPTISKSIRRPRSSKTTAPISGRSTCFGYADAAHRRRGDPDRERGDPAICRRSLSAGRHRPPGIDRSLLHQWLWLHRHRTGKGLFVPMLDKKAPPEVKTYTLGKGLSRLDYPLTHILRAANSARSFQRRRRLSTVTHHQLDHGNAADELAKWAQCEGVLRTTARAAQHRQGGRREFTLYQAELARHKAAA